MIRPGAAWYVFASLAVVLNLVSAGFMTLRVHAIGGMLPLTLFIFVLEVLLPAGSLVYTITQREHAIGLQKTTESIVRGAQIAADAIMLGVTWGRTREFRLPEKSLSSLLCEDATLYFVSMLCLNIVQIAIFLLSNTVLNPAPLTTGMTSILTSRFLLKLRQHVAQQTDPERSTPSTFPPNFVSRDFGSLEQSDEGRKIDEGTWVSRASTESSLSASVADPEAITETY